MTEVVIAKLAAAEKTLERWKAEAIALRDDEYVASRVAFWEKRVAELRELVRETLA